MFIFSILHSLDFSSILTLLVDSPFVSNCTISWTLDSSLFASNFTFTLVYFAITLNFFAPSTRNFKFFWISYRIDGGKVDMNVSICTCLNLDVLLRLWHYYWWENLQIGSRIFSRFIVNYALHYPKLTMCPLIGFLQRIEMFFAPHRLIL